MKSSSQLFPVELVSAELRNGVYQDLYSLKPNRCQDKTVEIALLHLHQNPEVADAPQVLFVHNIFQSHWQWMDAGPYEQMVSNLVAHGQSVWLMDWRAHGSSKINRDPSRNRLQIMAEHDLLAVVEFIQEKSQASCSIVASGFGAQMVQRAITGFQGIQKYIFVEAESLIPSKKNWLPGYRMVKYGRLLGKEWVKGPGSEMEPVGLFKDILLESGLFGRRHKALRLKAAEELLQLSDSIIWLCTRRSHERRAQRAMKRQATTHYISKEALPFTIEELISAQPV